MKNALIEFDNDEKALIKNQYFPQGTSNHEMQFCMGVAQSLGLNPVLKEIYFVERRSKVNNQWVTKIEPLVGRDAFLKLAHTTGKFGGMDSTTEIKPTFKLNNGVWEDANDLIATCKVYRTDVERPFVVEVAYSEYVQKTSKGEVTKFWKDKPQTMLKKVAESQALRKAFSIAGVYAEDEMPIIETEATSSTPKDTKKQTLGIEKPKEEPAKEYDKEAEEAFANSQAEENGIIEVDINE